MPTYVSLLNFTDQGIRTVKETIQRGDTGDTVSAAHYARL